MVGQEDKNIKNQQEIICLPTRYSTGPILTNSGLAKKLDKAISANILYEYIVIRLWEFNLGGKG